MNLSLIGVLVLLGWLPSVAFLYFHARTMWWKRPAGQSVFVMATVVAIVMTLAVLRTSFGVDLPDWIRAGSYLLILGALWWQLIIILRYRYGEHVPLASKNGAPGEKRLLDQKESR